MNIKIKNRKADKKSEATTIRLDGDIPAIIYSNGKEGEKITVDGGDFAAVLRGIKQGFLPATVLSLKTEDGKERRAIVKDIQYHRTTYNVIHLDLEELHDDVEVTVKIPIQCRGEMDSVGVKAGGVLRQVIRHLKVRCLPKHIPGSFDLSVRELDINQSKRLEDLSIPKEVRPLVGLRTVAATIAKR